MRIVQDQQFDTIVCGDIVLQDDVLVDGYVAIADGRIAAIGSGTPPAAQAIRRYDDCLVFPGLIDAQIHAGSAEGAEGLQDASRAAAAGGVTTIVDMPFDAPDPVNSVARLQAKIGVVERLSIVDVALYATAPQGQSSYGIAELASAGAASIKVSTYEYHPVRFPRFSTAEMHCVFLEAAAVGLPVAFHNEDQELVDKFVERCRQNGDLSPMAHGASRPPIAELVADAQILELAAHTGVHCHIVHSSVAEGNRIAARYKALGQKVSVETCVHYLVFNEADMNRHGGFLKLNPPIRSEAERRALWSSLERGEIDLVSTDHVAWPADRKSDPDIFKNASGIPGLETLLPALYTGMVADRGLSPCEVARLTAANPARHFGFARKGRIAPGADADLAVFRRGENVFDASAMTSKVKWSPYDGMRMAGEVAATYVRGVAVFDEAEIRAAPGYGRFVRPSRSEVS
jgi:allantoinase